MIERLGACGCVTAVLSNMMLLGASASLQPETPLRITNNLDPIASDGFGPYCAFPCLS